MGALDHQGGAAVAGMTRFAFTIPGQPRGKGRPKFSTRGGKVRTYTDAQTASYENLARLACQAAMAGASPLTSAVELTVLIRLTPPQSASKKARADMLAGVVKPTKKPDFDNVVKAVLDGLNGVAFVDDAQVTWCNTGKVYAATAGVDVIVEPDTVAVRSIEQARAAA